MFYKKNTRFARLKAIFVLPLTVCAVMFYTVACNKTPQQTGSGTYDTIMMGSEKVILLKNLAGDSTALIPIPISPPLPLRQALALDLSNSKDPVFTSVETLPEFPGGEEARSKYLNKNLKYPEEAKKKGLEGEVFVSFLVGKDGSISNPVIIKSIGNGFDEEAMKVINEMPKWKPGIQNGKPVRVRLNMPIYFKLK